MTMTRVEIVAELDAQIDDHIGHIMKAAESGDKRLLDGVLKARAYPLAGLYDAKVIVTKLPEKE